MDNGNSNKKIEEDSVITENEKNITVESETSESAGKENWHSQLWSWLGDHNTQIQAIAIALTFIVTLVLAIFAGLSSCEVKKQRELAFKQFAIANAPAVRIFIKPDIKYENNMPMAQYELVNKGGQIEAVTLQSVGFCFKKDVTEIINPVIEKKAYYDRLSRDTKITGLIYDKNPEILKWLKDALEGNLGSLYFYIQVEYTIPKALSLTGQDEKDKTYDIALWDKDVKKLRDVSPELQKNAIKFVEAQILVSPLGVASDEKGVKKPTPTANRSE